MKQNFEFRKPRTLQDPATLEELREIFAQRIENYFKEDYGQRATAQKVRNGEKIGVWTGAWEDCLAGAITTDLGIRSLEELDYAKSIFFRPPKEKKDN